MTDADVVVVGCGFAGAVAAITAHDAGARVVVIEKMPDPGGISVCSFGGVRVARDANAALAYLERTNDGTAPKPVLEALARGMAMLPEAVARLAGAVGGQTVLRPSPANYPFPGNETFGFVEVELEGFAPDVAYPHVRGAPGGAKLFEMLARNLAARGIAPVCGTRATALSTSSEGVVQGVRAERAGRAIEIAARRGVVLACGGFEGDRAMQRAYWPEHPVLNAAFRGNTGDGIRMAQALGADLWHMWHYHGSYGFAGPDEAYPFGIRTKRLPDWQPGTPPRGDVVMPWILLDRRGRRFMNEYEPYLQDTGARPFARYDAAAQRAAANPATLIVDADGFATYPLGRPTWHERGVGFEWGTDNARALAAGIFARADDVAGVARVMGLDAESVAAALSQWNAAVARGTDEAFGRPSGSMVAIARPPFYAALVHPIVSNTQGGPVHDERQRVLRPDGSPIPGLFAAGELGSVFGHLYMSGGNIAECFVGGAVAGREASGGTS